MWTLHFIVKTYMSPVVLSKRTIKKYMHHMFNIHSSHKAQNRKGNSFFPKPVPYKNVVSAKTPKEYLDLMR